jgi:hypothetical protein
MDEVLCLDRGKETCLYVNSLYSCYDLSKKTSHTFTEGMDVWNDSDQPAPPLVMTEIDLFAKSRAAWAQTAHGTWFVATREATFFLRSQRDGIHYGVFRTASQYSRRPETMIVKNLKLDLAMAFAQQLAEDADPSIALRAAPWRKGKKPSVKQVEYASRIGIDVAGKTKSEIADAITMRTVERMGL